MKNYLFKKYAFVFPSAYLVVLSVIIFIYSFHTSQFDAGINVNIFKTDLPRCIDGFCSGNFVGTWAVFPGLLLLSMFTDAFTIRTLTLIVPALITAFLLSIIGWLVDIKSKKL